MSVSEINLVYSLFAQINSVYHFCVIVRNVGQFRRLRYRKSLLMDQPEELSSLFVIDLDVFSHHLDVQRIAILLSEVVSEVWCCELKTLNTCTERL